MLNLTILIPEILKNLISIPPPKDDIKNSENQNSQKQDENNKELN